MSGLAPPFGEILEEGPWLRGDGDVAASAAMAEPFRAAMRRLAAGTCAVTVRQGDEILGLTATSVTSLSMDPPALLVSIRKQSPVLKAITAARAFTVHILSDGQEHEANVFAGRHGSGSRASLVGWSHAGADPQRLNDAICHIDCSVAKLVPVFSHMLVVGAAASVDLGPQSRPLVYFDGAFHALQPGESP